MVNLGLPWPFVSQVFPLATASREHGTLRGTRPGGFQEQLCTDGVRRAVIFLGMP